MKKRIVAAAFILALSAGSNLTAFAAPETMPDGTVFDAEFYAQTYPDVVQIYGTDASALYSHYVDFGKAEGRLTIAPVVTEDNLNQQIQNAESAGYTVRTLTFGKGLLGNGWKEVYYKTSPDSDWVMAYGPEKGEPLGDITSSGVGYLTTDIYDVHIPSTYFGIKFIDTEGKEGVWETNNLQMGLNYNPVKNMMFAFIPDDWYWVESDGSEVKITISWLGTETSATIEWDANRRENLAYKDMLYKQQHGLQ